MFFDLQLWSVYIAQEGEKIDFARGVELRLDMETDQHSKNSGDG